MVRKSDMVRELVGQKDYQAALSIVKDFRLGITPAQRDKMTRAYECMVHSRFYRSIGTDITACVREGVEVLVGLYGGSSADDIHQ